MIKNTFYINQHKPKTSICFTSSFLNRRFKMFHRAKKIPVTQKDKDEKIPLYKLERVRRMRRTEEEKAEKEFEKESEKESERSERSEEEKTENEKEEEKKEKGEKKKRKIRLDMHLEQVKQIKYHCISYFEF